MTAYAVFSGYDMDILKVSALTLVSLVALLILKQSRPEWAVMIRLGMTVMVVGFLLGMVSTLLDFAKTLGGNTALLPDGMWSLLMKALGVTLVTEVLASVCRDCGEGSMAQWVETAGKLEILILSLPLITQVLTTVKNLLQVV